MPTVRWDERPPDGPFDDDADAHQANLAAPAPESSAPTGPRTARGQDHGNDTQPVPVRLTHRFLQAGPVRGPTTESASSLVSQGRDCVC
jgi:hypothetical protein